MRECVFESLKWCSVKLVLEDLFPYIIAEARSAIIEAETEVLNLLFPLRYWGE